jgi:hypothetical protein
MNDLLNRLIKKRAIISKCKSYRYWLCREVLKSEKFKPVVFIMLNPSTADGLKDDPTVRRCVSYVESWKCSHLIIVNIFAYRSTQPCNLWGVDVKDPIGPLNNGAIMTALNIAYENEGIVVAAWGEHGSYMSRGETVLKSIYKYNPFCLKINKSGNPAHPLYQRKDAQLIRLNEN